MEISPFASLEDSSSPHRKSCREMSCALLYCSIGVVVEEEVLLTVVEHEVVDVACDVVLGKETLVGMVLVPETVAALVAGVSSRVFELVLVKRLRRWLREDLPAVVLHAIDVAVAVLVVVMPPVSAELLRRGRSAEPTCLDVESRSTTLELVLSV